MTTKTITYGDSSYTIKTRMPDHWDTSATVTVTITDKAGTDLVDGQAVTKYAGDTVAGAVVAGAFSFVLTTGTALEQGDLIVVGSDAEGFHKYEVDGYTAASKTVRLLTGLQEALSIGMAVRGLELGYTLDASAEAWTDVGQVYVKWIPSTDNQPFTELYDVLVARSAVAGFEDEFRAAFDSLYNETVSEDWLKWEDRARDRITREFAYYGKDFNKIVDGEQTRELMIIEVAMLIGVSHNMDEVQYKRLEKDKEYQLEILMKLPIWDDSDQDGQEDEGETEVGDQSVGFQRGIF